MMTKQELALAIVEMARLNKPATYDDSAVFGGDVGVLTGLVWALTGQRPGSMYFRRQYFIDLFKDCDVPFTLNERRAIRLDPDWLKGDSSAQS